MIWLTRLSLAAGLLAGITAFAPAIASEFSNDKLRQLMEQRAQRATPPEATGLSANSQAAPVGPSAARLQERAQLLQSGESALARLEVDRALQAFERAALILHAADTEIALVRAYMQGGEYRRALAFGAHTAGAHLDVVGGSALYAWLLHIGGQPAIAQRLLKETQARIPGNPLVMRVNQQLQTGTPLATRATPELLVLPTRLAPYGSAQKLPANAAVVGSGLLLLGGKQALVPLSLLPHSGRLWLRNGLGQLSAARLVRRLPSAEVALLQLQSPLPFAADLVAHTGPAFPGSVGLAVEYGAAPEAMPAWPLLRTGFLGGFAANGNERNLGIEMPPGARGGPVFDAAGRFVGVALQGKAGAPDSLMRC